MEVKSEKMGEMKNKLSYKLESDEGSAHSGKKTVIRVSSDFPFQSSR